MLTTYRQRTQLLLNDVTQAQYNLFDLTSYINTARSQVAGESESIRNYASLALSASTRQYGFSSITLGSPSTGIQGVFNVRQALVALGSGAVWVQPRSFQYFTLYALNNVVPPTGLPTMWAQFGQGVAGTIFVDPLPDTSYTLQLDTVCYPIDLVDNSTAEAIPYPWTDCVPYFAAYLALLSMQRMDDANNMFQRYEQFVTRARGMSNPDVLPNQYEQTRDPTLSNKLGIKPVRGMAS